MLFSRRHLPTHSKPRTLSPVGTTTEDLPPLEYDVSPWNYHATTSERHHDHDRHVGAEPGVNPRSHESAEEYSHFKQECLIDVVDYDSEDIKFQRLTNESLINLLQKERADGIPPSMVRWINIAGIDWKVLSSLALRFNFHSLALEDILHETGHTHSKADYYPNHLFIRILCHSLARHPHQAASSPLTSPSNSCHREIQHVKPYTDYPDSWKQQNTDGIEVFIPNDSKLSFEAHIEDHRQTEESPIKMSYSKGKHKDAGPNQYWRSSLAKRFTSLSGNNTPARETRRKQIELLTEKDSVKIKREPLFVFLFRTGTVVSIHPTSLGYTSPIFDRLHRVDSVLRTSEDASLLVESLLDLVVDRILEVMDEYQAKINTLEHKILLRPAIESVRSLHILSGDLIMHRRTIEPIRTMIHGLRQYDLERSRALANILSMECASSSDTNTENGNDNKAGLSDNVEASLDNTKSKHTDKKRRQRRRGIFKEEHFPPVSLQYSKAGSKNSSKERGGYFSYKSKVYLADVGDHLDFALTSLDMFSATSENLINYAFNIASYDMNTVMNRLTFATIVFLPLTLLTGYYGMNFANFWSVEQHSDAFFWKTAIPVMALLIPLFLYDDIRQGIQLLKRRSMSLRVSRMN